MKQVPKATEMGMARPGATRAAVPACAVHRPRHAFAARPWHGSLIATMPALGEGHAPGRKSILANGTCRLKEPST